MRESLRGSSFSYVFRLSSGQEGTSTTFKGEAIASRNLYEPNENGEANGRVEWSFGETRCTYAYVHCFSILTVTNIADIGRESVHDVNKVRVRRTKHDKGVDARFFSVSPNLSETDPPFFPSFLDRDTVHVAIFRFSRSEY